MMVSKSRGIDIKEAIGKYEFTVVPRALFASDGSMLHCSLKSALMGILEKMNTSENNAVSLPQEDVTPTPIRSSETSTPSRQNVAILDGMAELQSIVKPPGINTCEQFAEHFNTHVFSKYHAYDELRLIFDRYDLQKSLKSCTRTQRQGKDDPVYYHITDSTHIANVKMKRLLSHSKTKHELTVYLAQKCLEYAERNRRCLVVSWGCECAATHLHTYHLQSDQEEADTKIILHARDASVNGATEVNIHSPDTDVFVLAIRRYPELCQNTFFVTGTGQRHRRIDLKPIYQALGPIKAAALPAFHAFSGADNTGSFSGKGKIACWKALNSADNDTLLAFSQLGMSEDPTPEVLFGIEKFVCNLYQPNTKFITVPELRWHLFKKKEAQSEKLPPTQGALHEAILRTHYQAIVWNNDTVSNPTLPSPERYGWKDDSDHWTPVMTTILPAPEAIIQLVKCGCSKERCATNRCQCRKADLPCTELCSCSDAEEMCQNVPDEDLYDTEDNSDDDYDESSDTDV